MVHFVGSAVTTTESKVHIQEEADSYGLVHFVGSAVTTTESKVHIQEEADIFPFQPKQKLWCHMEECSIK